MDLAIKRMVTFENEGAVKALLDVSVDETFLIRGLRIVDSKNGLFVSMPRLQTKQGKWIDLVSPLKSEIREQLNTALLAYFTENKNRSAEPTPSI